jgi:hypothetical protein
MLEGPWVAIGQDADKPRKPASFWGARSWSPTTIYYSHMESPREVLFLGPYCVP